MVLFRKHLRFVCCDDCFKLFETIVSQLSPFHCSSLNVSESSTDVSSHIKPGLEGRHNQVLEAEFKNRRRLNNLNGIEDVKLEQRMRTLQSDLQAELSRQKRAIALVNRRLTDIKAYQDVLKDKYGVESMCSDVTQHGINNDCSQRSKSSFQALRREIDQKRKELDPVYQQRTMRYKCIDRLKQQNKVIPFDRNISSLTTILQKYSKTTRGNSVLKPKGVIVTVSGAKRSHSFIEPALRGFVKEAPPSFRSDYHQ